MEKLPSNLINEEILTRLDLDTLCTVACVNKALRFSVDHQLLPFLSSLDLPSSLIPDAISLHHILTRCSNANGGTLKLKSLSLNCQSLHDSFFPPFLAAHLHQLNLYCCSSLSSRIFLSIAKKCPFLRVLMLEFADQDSPSLFEVNLVYMLGRCDLLEALANKRRLEDGSKQLKQLDLFSCIGLSADAWKLLRKPLFSGLHWIGIGQTRLGSKRGGVMTEIHNERPWLTLCLDGCEMGCHDGWQFHHRLQC